MENPPQVIPWIFPEPGKPLKNQDRAAFKEHLIDHHAALDINSPRSPVVLLSIICTLGESCSCKEVLEGMIKFGMRAMRVDMKLGEQSDQLQLLRKVKTDLAEISAKLRRVVPIAIIGDVKGPQILTGKLYKVDKISLKRGELITLTTHPGWEDRGTADKLYVDFKQLPYILKPRDTIYLDCGRIELNVRGTVDSDIVCEILTDGEIGDHRDLVVKNVPLDLPPITDKDKKDIRFLVDEKVDAIFASAIVNKFGVRQIRSELGENGKSILVFTKIENILAFTNFDEILAESDGVIVNRGKMGIDMSPEKVLQAQKSMFAKATKAGKPIYALTEYLNSMVHRDCPTIAESTDVVTSVIDGADAIILVEETAIGDHPILAVKTLSTLAREAEAQIWQKELYLSLDNIAAPPLDPAHAICIAAVQAALKCHATAILVVTTSGRSAQVIARYKPRCPILGITRYGSVARQLNLWRGIIPIHYIAAPNPCFPRDVDLRLQYAIEFGKIEGIIGPGDALVLVNGWRQGAGFTNNIRLVYASATDPWVYPHSPSPNLSTDPQDQEISFVPN